HEASVRVRLWAGSLKLSLPDCLLGSEFEAMHYINMSRVTPNKADARGAVQHAAAVLQTLGRQSEGRQLLARSAAGDFEKQKANKKRAVVSLKAVLNPLELVPIESESGTVVSFDQARFALEHPERLIRFMREALRDGVLTKPMLELVVDDAETA